jgi:hypothetical protein
MLVVIGIIGVLTAFLLPAVNSARESARQTHCSNNLRQQALAIHQHVASLKRYPGNGWGFLWVGEPYRGSAKSQPGGWIYSLAPYVQQSHIDALGRDLKPSERRASMRELIQRPVSLYLCPSRQPAPGPAMQRFAFRNVDLVPVVGKTDYAINEGDFITDTGGGPESLAEGDNPRYRWIDVSKATGVSFQRSEITPAHVRDGLGVTYLIGEKYVTSHNYETSDDPGYDQTMYSGVDLDLNRWTISPPLGDSREMDPRRFGSAHSAGCYMAFCDARVELVDYEIDPTIHRNRGHRSNEKGKPR